MSTVAANGAITVNVTDADGDLSNVVPVFTLNDGTAELAHVFATPAFTAPYTSSTRSVLVGPDGFQYIFVRDAGWPVGNLSLEVLAFDSAGHSTSVTFTFTVTAAIVIPPGGPGGVIGGTSIDGSTNLPLVLPVVRIRVAYDYEPAWVDSIEWKAAHDPLPVTRGTSFFTIAADGSGATAINATITRPAPSVFAEVIGTSFWTLGGIMASPVGTVPTPIAASVTLAGIGSIITGSPLDGIAGFTYAISDVGQSSVIEQKRVWWAAATVWNGMPSMLSGVTFQRLAKGQYRFTGPRATGTAFPQMVVTPCTAGVFLESTIIALDMVDLFCTDVLGASVEACFNVLYPKTEPLAIGVQYTNAFACIDAVGGIVDGYGIASVTVPVTGRYRITLTNGITASACAAIAVSASGDGIGRVYAVEHVSDTVKDIRWANRLAAPLATAFNVVFIQGVQPKLGDVIHTTHFGSESPFGNEQTFGYGDTVFQFRARLPRQKCESIRFRIESLPPPGAISPGVGGIRLNELALEVGIKAGMVKLGANKSR